MESPVNQGTLFLFVVFHCLFGIAFLFCSFFQRKTRGISLDDWPKVY